MNVNQNSRLNRIQIYKGINKILENNIKDINKSIIIILNMIKL